MASLRSQLASRFSHLALKRDDTDPAALVSRLRRLNRVIQHLPWRPAAGISREDTILAGVPGTWYRPAQARGTLLYLHGGAFVSGLNNLYHRLAATLAERLQYQVFLIDYRLAPEHPFPAAADDCLAVYTALAHQANGGKLALAGDSAGGNLTLVTLLSARDNGLRLPDATVALSPVTDMARPAAWRSANDPRDCLLSARMISQANSLYVGTTDPACTRISPLRGQLSNLPPLLILASHSECLRDDSLDFAAACRQQGSTVTVLTRPDMPHVWPVFLGLMPEADTDLQACIDFIHQQPRQPAGTLTHTLHTTARNLT